MVEAVAQFDYPANDSDELTLRTGDIIRNVVQQEGGWWEGELNGRRGVFPDNFVKVHVPATPKEELDNLSNDVHLRKGNVRKCKAIFSYKPVNDDELELQIDDVIDVIDEVEDGWWKGVLRGNTGVFPSNFVQELETPPVVAADVTNHKEQDVTQEQAVIDSKPKPAKGIAAIFHGGVPKLKHSASDGQENKNKVPLPQRPAAFVSPNSNEAPVLPPKQAKDLAKVLFNYEALNEDELTINEGEIITVLSKDVEDKGWWKGELNGRTGVFPDNFVEIIAQVEPLRPKKPDRVDKLPAKPPGLNLASVVTEAVSNKADAKDGDIPSPQNRNLPPLVGGVKLPDFPKKEDKPDRPAPPLPIKKPLIPPPMKKTNRLSTGPSVFDGLTDEMKAKNEAKNNQEPLVSPARLGDDLDLDSVETTTEKLDHKTAQRPKFPNRRPPSHVYVKENHDTTPEKENGDISKENQAPWMLELMRNQAMKRVSQGTPDAKPNRDAMKETDERPVLKPVTPRLSAEVTDSKPLPTRPVIPKPPLPSVSKPPITMKATVLDLKRSRSSTNVPDPTTPPVQLDTESSLPDVIRAVQTWKDFCATRTSLDETRREVRELHEALEVFKAQFSKQLAEVVSELETEKRARILLQSELDSLKKTMAHK